MRRRRHPVASQNLRVFRNERSFKEVRMKRMHDNTHIRSLQAGFIAAALILASANSATGAESASQVRPSTIMTGQPAVAFPLSPIPNLPAVPWLMLERAPKVPQIDTLLSPVPDTLKSAFGTRSRLPMWPDNLVAAGNDPRNG
jgi:hypothetical protein